jgi:hypothetical protein
MVRFYWYGLTVIYLACCVAGMISRLGWGFSAGMILGIAFGATARGGYCDVPRQVRRDGDRVLRGSLVPFIVAVAWLIVTYSSVRL